MYWKFFLAHSKNLEEIVELKKAKNKSLNLTLNRAGSASFQYAMDEKFAELIAAHETAIKAYRFNVRATMAHRLSGGRGNVWDLIWTGFVATVDEDVSGNQMTVNCLGWLARLDRRMIRRDKTYIYAAGASTDDAEIIFDLLGEVNGIASGEHGAGIVSAPIQEVGGTYTVRWPLGSVPNTPTWIKKGGKLPNEGVGGSTAYVPAYRGKTYQKNQNVGQAVQELTEVENGCDVSVDPLTRELNIFRRRMTIRDDVIFGYNWGPKNIQQLGRQIDGSVTTNYVLVTGTAGSVPKYQDDTASMDLYGPIEEVISLSDVVDQVTTPTGVSQSILWTYAAGEVALRSYPKQTFSLTPFPYHPDRGVPEPFVDYHIGDQVRFTAIWGKRINVQNLGVRVFGISVSIDDNGNEKLGQLQFSPGG